MLTFTLLDAVTATGAGTALESWMKDKLFQAKGSTSSGPGAAVVLVQGSNDNSTWETIATFTLTLGTVVTSDSFASDSKWRYIRGNVQSISGTGAAVTLYLAT